LPEDKVAFLNRTNVANYVKVFLQWEQRWWASEAYSTHIVLLDEGEDNKKWRVISELSSQEEA